MSKTYQWNTGRHYDKHGQRIVAQVNMDDQKIYFSDLSRHINGYVPITGFVQTDRFAVEMLVMTNYDHGNYATSGVSLEWKEN
jgi:hypothetical protein